MFDAGVGTGVGISSKSKKGRVETGVYSDQSIVINKGKIKRVSKYKMGTSAGIGIANFGNSLEVEHEIHEPSAKQNYVDHTWLFPNPIKIAGCEHTTKNYESGLSFNLFKYDEIKKDSLFIGIDISAHMGIGGHIKLGFDFGVDDVC